MTHTYILFESSGVELQNDQGGGVKTSRPSENPANHLVIRGKLLEGFGFEGPRFPHPIQWKTIQGEGNEIRTADLEEPAFPLSKGGLERGQENSARNVTESYPEVVPLPLISKK